MSLYLGNKKVCPAIKVDTITNNQDRLIAANGTYTADEGYTGFGTITVNVPSEQPVITELNITPTTSAQTITPPSGTDGYAPINVAAVTSSIDNNIVAGNIKKDVTILGVTGTLETGSTPTGTLSITANGVYDVTNYASADVSVSSSGILLAVTNLVSGIPRNFYLTLGNNNTWNYDPLPTSIQGSGRQDWSYNYYTIVWNIEPNTDYTLFSDDGMYVVRERLINISENTFLSFNKTTGGGSN